MIFLYLLLGRTGEAAVRAARSVNLRRSRGDGGQATAEYGLVLLAAAAIAMALIAWATHSQAIPALFDRIVKKLIDGV
jgi:hypothetical protein